MALLPGRQMFYRSLTNQLMFVLDQKIIWFQWEELKNIGVPELSFEFAVLHTNISLNVVCQFRVCSSFLQYIFKLDIRNKFPITVLNVQSPIFRKRKTSRVIIVANTMNKFKSNRTIFQQYPVEILISRNKLLSIQLAKMLGRCAGIERLVRMFLIPLQVL